jgi:Fe-S-cluster-containing hydrogenase component 2
VLAVDSSQCIGCRRCAVACPETAVTVERGVDISSILHGPTPLNVTRGTQVCGGWGTTIAVDPLVVSVQRRLAALGKPPALIASLQRCPECTGSGPDR